MEEDCATAQKYIDEVIKRLLFLKKLDGYPVIRELDNDDEEEVSSLLDMNEIEKLARWEKIELNMNCKEMKMIEGYAMHCK